MNCNSLSSSDLGRGPFSATKLWNDVVQQMRISVPVKRRRWRMKVYEDVFVASEALDWLHGYLKENPHFGPHVSRQQALQLCEKFLKNGIIADARGKQYNGTFEDNSHVYRFVKNARYSPYKTMCSVKRVDANSLIIKDGCETKKNSEVSKTQLNVVNGKLNFVFNDEEELHQNTVPFKHTVATPSVEGRRNSHSRSTPFTSSAPSRTPLVNKLNVRQSASRIESRSLVKTEDKKKRSRRYGRLSDVIMNPAAFVANNKRTLSEKEVREVWWSIATTRLKRLMDLDDDTLTNALRSEGYDTSCICLNAQNQTFPKAIDVIPQWLISAMKCLINWSSEEDFDKEGFPSYIGFERDIFKAILEFFSKNQECPLVPRHLLMIFRKTVDFLFTCKVTAMRSLQYSCLFIPPKKRELLQVLLKFIVRLTENHVVSLSDDLPIKEMLIQSFSRVIFGVSADMDVIRLSYFMIEKFPEYFSNPEGLQFQVDQRLLFLKNCRENKFTIRGGVTSSYCERVTPQEYKEQSLITSQRSLKDLLANIIGDEDMDEKERRRKLKQFEKSYPEIYQASFPGDNLSTCSQRSEKLRQVMKPLKVLKSLR